MHSNEAEILTAATADGGKTIQKRKRPLWGLAALILIFLITLSILYMANVQIRRDQQKDLFDNGLLGVQLELDGTAREGYLNEKGELAIPALYEQALAFADNDLAAVKQDGLWGFIDKKGETVIPCTYADTLGFGKGKLAPVKLNGLWGYVNKNGEVAVPCSFEAAEPFAENGLAAVTVNGKQGYINVSGKLVIDAQFEKAGLFDTENHAIVKIFGQWGVINKHGRFEINPQFDALGEFSPCGLALIEKNGRYGYIDRDGEYAVLPTLYDAAPFAENGLAAVCAEEGGLYSYIDAEGKTVIPAQFERATPFADNGLAAVAIIESTQGGTALSWGFVNKHGEFVIPPTFRYAGTFVSGLAVVYDESKFYYVDKTGATAFTPPESCIYASSFFDDGYALLYCRDEEDGALFSYYVQIIDTTGRVIHTQRLSATAADTFPYLTFY